MYIEKYGSIFMYLYIYMHVKRFSVAFQRTISHGSKEDNHRIINVSHCSHVVKM